jgi:ADP-ribose pyrophosphatase YjhB (NUDIX family)
MGGTIFKYYPQIIAGSLLVSFAFYVLMRGSEIILESQRSVSFAGPPWNHKGKTVESSVIFHSKYLRVESHTVRTKLGELLSGWMWVDFDDQVNVLVQDNKNNFVVIRQEKYGLPKATLSVVSGAIALNEKPKEAAERELLNELGLISTEWVFLGKFRTDANRGGGFVYSFLATKAKPAPRGVERNKKEVEQQEIIRMTSKGLHRAVMQGDFGEAKWSNTVSLALLRLGGSDAPIIPLVDVPANQGKQE